MWEGRTDKHLVDTKKKRHELGEKLVAGEMPFYDNGHSLFCKYLLRGLQGAAGDHSKPFIDLYRLSEYMQKGINSEMLEKSLQNAARMVLPLSMKYRDGKMHPFKGTEGVLHKLLLPRALRAARLSPPAALSS